MKFHVTGGIASFICAITYLIGFAFLITFLAPYGFGTNQIDALAVTRLMAENPSILIAFNTIIYVINGLALALLVVALHDCLAHTVPEFASISRIFGTIWCTLVLGAGMVANVSVEQVHGLAAKPDAAVALWQVMHAVELGLGGGNEIAGGAWILSISIAAHFGRIFSKVSNLLGAMTSIAGLITIIPIFGEIAGAIFGLGAIVWFIAIGFELVRSPVKRSV